MAEQNDHKLEQFMREAYAREDVYRFKQVLHAAAERVEAKEAKETRVISINRRKNYTWMALAASMVLAVGAVWFLMDQPLDPQQLAVNELKEHHLRDTRSGEPGDVETTKRGLRELIRSNDLKGYLSASASELNDEAFNEKEGNWTRLYRAYAFLRLDQVDAAREELDGLNDPSKPQRSQRDYYLALANLLEGKKDEARSILQNAEMDFPWDEQIIGLLQQLKD